MCGIWGRFSRHQRIEREDLLDPIRKLAHRGPDGYGWYLDPSGQAALVHLRLSIVDLAGGAQPLASHDGRYLGIVNGELYDYHQHRQRLVEQGVKFRTHSDSEVLLNLFATGGAEALSPLSGEFTFIFYDLHERRVHYGRDLHGVKPLFFRHENATLTLGSEVKALQKGTPEFDEIYIKRYLSRVMVPPRTAIRGAFHVLPGRLYTYDVARDAIEWKRFQSLPLGRKRELKGRDAIERAGHELSEAVKRRLVADVEVGTYLSGGIDSALVAALMVKHGAKPKAFTVGFNQDATFDESAKAAAIARHLGIEHHVIHLTADNFLTHLKRSIVAFENPIANPHGVAKNLLSKLASSKVKVVLSGEGADEWFGGYPYMRVKKLRRFVETHPRIGQGAIENFLKAEGGVAKNHLEGQYADMDPAIAPYFEGIVPAIFNRLPERRQRFFMTGNGDESLILSAVAELAGYLKEDLEQAPGSEMDLNVWASARTDLLHYILSNLGDRQEMSHSLEGRTPFMDPKMVATAAGIHPNTLIRGLTEKWVLREVARPLLHRASAQQKKHAFFSPMQYLFQPEVTAEMDEGIRSVEKHTPWLPWKHYGQLLFEQKSDDPAKQAMLDQATTMRLILFSLGILVKDLHTPQLAEVRGYRLPQSVAEIAPSEFRLA